MAKSNTSVPFKGTKEQEAQLMQVIADHKEQPGALMPVLQQAQEIYGYLPLEVQEMISLGLDIPLEEVYGVVTFYSQFSLYPKGQYKISVCLGTACYVKGSGDIYDKLSRSLGIKGGDIKAIFLCLFPMYGGEGLVDIAVKFLHLLFGKFVDDFSRFGIDVSLPYGRAL